MQDPTLQAIYKAKIAYKFKLNLAEELTTLEALLPSP